MEFNGLNSAQFFVALLWLILSLNYLEFSQGKICNPHPTRCPLKPRWKCYCDDFTKVQFHCVNNELLPLPCGSKEIPTTQSFTTVQPTTRPSCHVPTIPFGKVSYDRNSGIAAVQCQGEHDSMNTHCRNNGWDPPLSVDKCSCEILPPSGFEKVIAEYDHDKISSYYPRHTIVTYKCDDTTRKVIWKTTCGSTGWKSKPPPTLHCKTSDISTMQTPTKPHPISSERHQSDEHTVIIVSGSTGAILGALIILVVVVTCQRRLHYHRIRRARLRHQQDQDAFSAFITYHRDACMLLPSYDEAMTQNEQGEPPSFEEALGNEETTANVGSTNSPSLATEGLSSDTTTVSVDANSRAHLNSAQQTQSEHNSEDNNSQQLVTPGSEDSRFFRSLRTLFGGRAFRPDAIYCRFVTEEEERVPAVVNEESTTRNVVANDELTNVLTHAGLY